MNLIGRLEAATGADRELDDAIATALFEDKHRVCIKGLSDEAGGMWMFRHPDGSIGSSLRFTASIDAALTLADSFSDAEVWQLWNAALTACSCAEACLRKDLPRFLVLAALRALQDRKP